MTWPDAVKTSADPQRAKHFFQLLCEKIGKSSVSKLPADQARILASLFAGSEALSTSLVAHPQWLKLLDAGALKFPRRKQGFAAEVDTSALVQSRDYESALGQIRELK